MSSITTKDGVEIFYKDWGRSAHRLQPRLAAVSRRLGRPDAVLPPHGYRVIAHDRRGHGRSSQPSDGNDMDPYADDLAALEAHSTWEAVHVGHSTGGGEVVHYMAVTKSESPKP